MQPIKTCTVSRCRSSSTRNLVGIVQWQKKGFRVLHEQRINQCTLTLEFLVMGHFVWEALGSSRQQQHALAIEFLFKMDNQRPNRLLYIYSLRHFWGNVASFTLNVEMDTSNIQLSICCQIDADIAISIVRSDLKKCCSSNIKWVIETSKH